MKKIFLFFLLFFITFLLIPRDFILDFFKVKSSVPEKVELISVLGGGAIGNKNHFVLGRASLERLKLGVSLFKSGRGKKIFFAGLRGEQKLANKFFIENGVDKSSIVEFYYRNTNDYGTYGDLRMIFDVLKKYGFKSVLLVTSPYHERRCKYLVDKILRNHGERIKVFFAHIENEGEIKNCSILRFYKLILHEFFALLYLKVLK